MSAAEISMGSVCVRTAPLSLPGADAWSVLVVGSALFTSAARSDSRLGSCRRQPSRAAGTFGLLAEQLTMHWFGQEMKKKRKENKKKQDNRA